MTLKTTSWWQQQFPSTPFSHPENSLALRIAVQLMVIVGIIATDVAAQTIMSLWAVPLSIIGGIWSWRSRNKRNTTAKFIIGIVMLSLMPLFFRNLIANINDTRMVLAELLIQLQVLHSFDLPRRKDLGYSMVIGLILMGVAGTVSQTLAFGGLLLLFLAVTIPTLILDYRSRLHLPDVQLSNKKKLSTPSDSPFSPRQVAIIFGLTTILGLAIFAIMPRFSGYQLQSFPVSSPIDLDDQRFGGENKGILNSGYDGKGNNSGRGKNRVEGAGELDDKFYYGFNSKINQNLRGEMKKELVLRVRSQSPGFWRALGFDRYTGQGWEVSRESQLVTVKRYPWNYRFTIPEPITKAKTKDIIQSYTVVSDLPNLIPLLPNPKLLFFPTIEIQTDTEGGVRSPVELFDGLTYTVVSSVPYRDRTLLGKASENYPSNITNYYLEVPEKILPKVKQLTEQLLAQSEKPLTSTYEKALFLAQKVKQNYAILPNIPFFEEKEDLVEAFLFRYKGGYGDHFSTVFTIMLRSVGIPARFAVGFAPGVFNHFTGYYMVHNTDAYAVTEVFFPEYGWYAFDAIPGHDLIPPSIEENQTFGLLGQLWNWVASWLPSPITAFISYIWTEIFKGFFSFILWLWSFFSGSFLGAILGLISVTFVAFLTYLGWQGLKVVKDNAQLAKLSPTARLYQQLLRILARRGYPKHPAQTPLEYARNVPIHQPLVQEVCQAYVDWRYGGKTTDLTQWQLQMKSIGKYNGRTNPLS